MKKIENETLVCQTKEYIKSEKVNVVPKKQRGRPRKVTVPNPNEPIKRSQLPMLTIQDMSADKLREQLIKYMKERNVKFSYKNDRERIVTTTGTLRLENAPENKRKVEGRKTPKSDNRTVFYDVRHGIFRQFDNDSIVAVNVK